MAATKTNKSNKSQAKSQVQYITINGESWTPAEIGNLVGMTEDTVQTTPQAALESLVNTKLEAQVAKQEAKEAKREAANAKRTERAPRKAKKVKPTTRANKAARIMNGPTAEEASWVDLIMEQLVEDPTRSSTDAHRLAGYHTISNKNSYNPECNGARRTISILYRAGLLDAEMERRLALAATETK